VTQQQQQQQQQQRERYSVHKRALVHCLLADERRLTGVGRNGGHLSSLRDTTLSDYIHGSVAMQAASRSLSDASQRFLTFDRPSSAFQVANSGRTLIHSPCCPLLSSSPLDSPPKRSTERHTALCSTAFSEGRHVCKVKIERLRGKGLLHLGCMRPAAAPGPSARGRAGLEVEEDGNSWWLSSDGCLMRDGSILGFVGADMKEGDEILCCMDFSSDVLSFWRAHERLGGEVKGLRGPLHLAVCVEGAGSDCVVTLSGHQLL